MANYISYARSNYFKVKDATAFKDWCNKMNIEASISGDPTEKELWMINPNSSNEDSWPWDSIYDEETGTFSDSDFMQGLASHLQEGQIAVLIEIGFEKLRYLVGEAIAIAWDGTNEAITLERIYDLAEQRWGIKPTHASY